MELQEAVCAEHKLFFPLLIPSCPFLLPQSYIFEKNFYLFSPPPVTCGVSPFATTKKALGFPFLFLHWQWWSSCPWSCTEPLCPAAVLSQGRVHLCCFFMKYKIKNNKQISLQLLSGEAKAGWLWRTLWVGEQSPVLARLGQGDPRAQVKSNKGMGQATQPVLGGDTAVQVPTEIFLYLFFFVKFHLFITLDSCKQHAEPCWRCLQGFLIQKFIWDD